MCSLNLSAKVLPDSPIYFSSQPDLPHLNIYIYHSILLQDGISVLGVHKEVLDGVSSSEKHFYPMCSADVFAALTHTLYIWDNYIWLVVIACFVAVTGCPLISVCPFLLFDISCG